MRKVLDTNVILYYLAECLAEPLPLSGFYVSVVTEMELLSYPDISDSEENAVRSFLRDVTLVNLNENVRQVAIQIRRTHRLKLPDAIIAATAIVLDAELLTNDNQLLQIPEMISNSPKLKENK